MKHKLRLTLAALLFAGASYSQCTGTVSIAVAGATTGCGNRVLTATSSGNTWTQKTNFGSSARRYATGFSIGTKGYIGLGSTTGTNYLSDVWEYDPATNAWTQKASFGGTARYGASAFVIGTKAYVVGGFDGSYK